MRSVIQEELFGSEQYTRLCSICRGEFPRSGEFFPDGRCNDGMASFCRKCAHLRTQLRLSAKDTDTQFSQENMLVKECEECGERKTIREFYMSSHSQDGKTSSCKKCMDANYDLKQKHKLNPEGKSVYFIQDSRNNRVKISSGSNPFLDLANLQQGSSETLHILASFEANQEESAETIVNTLQSLFQTHHCGNGWFDMVPSLAQYISLIQQGDSEKAKLLLTPLENTQNDSLSKTAQKGGEGGAVTVEGQNYPNISAAAQVTGYAFEQLKEHLQSTEKNGTTVAAKQKKQISR
ncbi:MAG: hypothetical protein MAG581_00197 [Deltaproteobacteria bacterium]|jgi:hypothetical protein|nr:hypothetical protein [Deltaproteobacteria bacterium]